MASIWVEGLAAGLEDALEALAAAVRDCPDGRWETPMWQVPAPGAAHQFLRADWSPVGDPAERAALAARWVERYSNPWSVAWHALEVLDYDLTGEFEPWSPPPPFAGHPHWRDLPALERGWTKAELLGYVAHCRGRVVATLGAMTEALAARPMPPGHRYSGQPHARIIVGLLRHTSEHAAQVQQFGLAQQGEVTGQP